MFEVLRKYFDQRFSLTATEFDFIKDQFIHKHLKKGDLLLREGDVAKYAAFIVNGCMRSYVIDKKGKEHIVQFAPEEWWIADNDSLRSSKPSIYFMDAIEDSDLLLVDTPGHLNILANVPAYANSFQTGLQKHTAAKDKRIVASLSATAEEKYTEFLATYPSLSLRIPQHMLASYLGIVPETLSRVRKQLSRKK